MTKGEMVNDEDRLTTHAGLMFGPQFSTALVDTLAALAEDVQRTRKIVCDAVARSLAPFAEGGEGFRAALAACAGLGAAGRLADAYTGSVAGQAIAAAAFRLPPPPEPLHIVLHVHVVLAESDAPRHIDTTGEESREWEM